MQGPPALCPRPGTLSMPSSPSSALTESVRPLPVHSRPRLILSLLGSFLQFLDCGHDIQFAYVYADRVLLGSPSSVRPMQWLNVEE